MTGLKRKVIDILACPIDKYYPLKLIDLESIKEEIKEGVIICSKCNRFYPIIDEIPIMLPDDLRNRKEELDFLKKWENKLPADIVYKGYPFHLEKK